MVLPFAFPIPAFACHMSASLKAFKALTAMPDLNS